MLISPFDEKPNLISPFDDEPTGTNDNDNILKAGGYGFMSAAGNAIHTAQDALTRIAKPSYKTDEEWQASQPGLVKGISKLGQEVEKDYQRNYSAWSPNRIAYGVGGVAPYAIAIGATTAAASKTGNYKMVGDMANTAVRSANLFGKYTPQAAKAAEIIAPAATVTAAEKVPESGLEWQGAYDDFIVDAKRNGTYVQGETEKQAEQVSNEVFKDNMMLLNSTGLLETLAITTKLPVSKVKSVVAKLIGGAALNAGEEMAQTVFPKAEAGKEYNLTDEDVLESGVIGAIAGGGMQGAGMVADHYLGSNTDPAATQSAHDDAEEQTDPHFNDVQNQAWSEAQWVSEQTGVPAEFIYRQWAHESENFTSPLARENHNFGGLTQTEPNGEENKQPDGRNYYKQYSDMHEYAQDYINSFLRHYDGVGNVQSLDEFAQVLKDNGYYGDSVENYINGLKGIEVPSGIGKVNGRNVSGQQTNPINIDGQDFFNENEYYKYLVDEKIENVIEDEDTEAWNFLSNYGTDKEAVMRQYPDIAEKMKTYRNMGIQEKPQQVEAGVTDASDQTKIIDRAIAYYDRTQNPAEKMLLEQLVNTNDVEGLKVAFPILDEQPSIPKFNPPPVHSLSDLSMSKEKKEALSGLTTALGNIAAQKFDDASAQSMQRKETLSSLTTALGNIAAKKFDDASAQSMQRKETLSSLTTALGNIAAKKFDDASARSMWRKNFRDQRKSTLANEIADAREQQAPEKMQALIHALHKVKEQKGQPLAHEIADAREQIPEQRKNIVNILNQVKEQKNQPPKAQEPIRTLQQVKTEKKLQDTISQLKHIDTSALMRVAYHAADKPGTNLIKQAIGKELANRGILPPAIAEGINFDRDMLDIAQKKKRQYTPMDEQTQRRLNALTGQEKGNIIIPDKDNSLGQIAKEKYTPSIPRPVKSGVLKTAEEKVSENAFRSAIHRGDYAKAVEIADQAGNKELADVLRNHAKFSMRRDGEQITPRVEKKSYGQRLLELADMHGIPTIPKLRKDLADNLQKAVQHMRKRMDSSGVDHSGALQTVEIPAEAPGGAVLQEAVRHGVPVSPKLKRHLEHNIPRAVQFAEKQMKNFGVKFSYVDRHERDRQRMRDAEKETQGYIPEGYKGSASGVLEGMAEHEIQSVQKDIKGLVEQGLSLEQIAKGYKVLYNKIKANKSEGMSEKDKTRYLSFLQGAINYVSEQGRNGKVLQFEGENGRRENQGRKGEVFSSSNWSGNDGRGLSNVDSEISLEKHPEKGAFSMPENKPKASVRGLTDKDVVQMVRDLTNTRIDLVPVGGKVAPKLERIAEFGGRMGCPVRYFDGVSKLHGFHAGGITYINRRSEIPHRWVFWHESFHWLRNNNPSLYQDMLSYFRGKISFSKLQIDAYKENLGRVELTDEEVIEEMLADAMPDVARRVGLMKQLAKDNPSLAERFVAWVQDTMSRFHEFFTTPAEGLSPSQKRGMTDALRNLARDMVDSDGGKIFMVNSRTGEISLKRNRQPLHSVLRGDSAVAYSSKNPIDNAPGKSDNEGKEARFFRGKINAVRHKIIVDTIEKVLDKPELLERVRDEDGLPSLREKILTDFRKARNYRVDLYNKFGKTPKLYEAVKDMQMVLDYGRWLIVNDRRIGEKLRSLSDGRDGRGSLSGIVEGLGGNLDGSGDSRRGQELSEFQSSRRIGEIPGNYRNNDPVIKQIRKEYIETNEHSDKGAFSMPENGNLTKENLGGYEEGSDVQGKKDDIMYSYNANDKESLLSKIRSVCSNGRGSVRVSRKNISRALEELSKMKIAFGKLDGENAAIFKDIEKVIRSKNAYDWEVILPQVGKSVARQLKISDQEPMQNYIADWLLTGAINNTSKEAGEFAAAMKKNPDFAERMMEVQEMFEHWNGMDAMERGQQVISWDKPGDNAKSVITKFLYTLHDQFLEEFGPVQRMVRAVEKRTGKVLSAAGDPYVALRLFRGHFGKSMAMIEGNVWAVKALKNVFPDINFDHFKTLNMILKDVGVLDNEKKMKEFMTYAVAKHVKDIHNTNKAKEEHKKMETPLTEEDCDEIIRKHADQFSKAQQELVNYSNTLAALLASSGVISRKRYYEMKNAWPNYVPLFRVFEENEEVNYGDSTKHMTGSLRDIINPLEGIIKNTYAFIKAAEKNKAKAKLGTVARMSGVGDYIEPVDHASPDDKTTITYFVDGKRMYLKTDPEIVKAVNSMNPQSMNWFMRAIRFPTQIARATITILNPEFAIRNLFRDIGDATIYSKYGFTPADFLRGFMHAIKKDELYYEFIASGAGQASALSMDRDYTQSTITKMMKPGKWKYVHPQTILDVLQAFGEYSEYGTRIGAYARARTAEQVKAKKEGRREDIAGITEAALDSRDLMDFARGGSSSRTWNQYSMFTNVTLQGWSKFFRTFDVSDPKQKKHAQSALLRLFCTGVLPSLLLWGLNHDDDRYKELPDWQKEKHWIFFVGDKMFRIPKGQDIGLQLFSNWIEKGLNSVYDNDSLTAQKVLNPLIDMLPSLMPTASLPIIEAITDHSFFTGYSIVPGYQKKLPDRMQYGTNTTSLAKFVGEQTGLSPRKVEHVLFGYTGGLGKAIPNLYDAVTGKKQLNTTIEEMPFVRGVMVMPYKNPKSVSDYYEAVDEQIKYYNEMKITGKRPAEFDPKLYARIRTANPIMQRLNKIERSIADDQKMPVEIKQQKQRKIQQKRIAIAKKVMGQQ